MTDTACTGCVVGEVSPGVDVSLGKSPGGNLHGDHDQTRNVEERLPAQSVLPQTRRMSDQWCLARA